MKTTYGTAMRAILALLLASSLGFSTAAFADREKMYSVTITNITHGTLFTPILVITHKAGHPVFTLGETASEELASVAEAGNTQPLQDKLMVSGLSYDAISTGAPLLPGKSVTVTIKSKPRYNHLSLAAMMLPTNDGFIAINGMALPRKVATKIIPGYDAGSETNSELCADIPGPQCGGEPLSPNDSGEGYVHIHSGIHGDGDLSTSQYDWKNPVAIVKIVRMN
jgi:hypothetical protein